MAHPLKRPPDKPTRGRNHDQSLQDSRPTRTNPFLASSSRASRNMSSSPSRGIIAYDSSRAERGQDKSRVRLAGESRRVDDLPVQADVGAYDEASMLGLPWISTFSPFAGGLESSYEPEDRVPSPTESVSSVGSTSQLLKKEPPSLAKKHRLSPAREMLRQKLMLDELKANIPRTTSPIPEERGRSTTRSLPHDMQKPPKASPRSVGAEFGRKPLPYMSTTAIVSKPPPRARSSDQPTTLQKRYPAAIASSLPPVAVAGASIQGSESPSILEPFSRYPQTDGDGDDKGSARISVRSLDSISAPPSYYSDESITQRELLARQRESINTQLPFPGDSKNDGAYILYTNEIEADDDLHQPSPGGDRRETCSVEYCCDSRNFCSIIGGVLFVLGFLGLFVVFPVLTLTTDYLTLHDKPGDLWKNGSYSGGDSNYTYIDYGPAWAHVNNNTYNLLSNIRQDLIDPQTPMSERTRISAMDGSQLNLVFSDEFNVDGRTFNPGDDPYWTAQDLWYGATMNMEWYDPDAVTTKDGTLQITFDDFPNHDLQYRSGMLNSWNKTCFKGGVLEVSVSLAGPAGVPGLWPGVWSLGNLARPGYPATTDGMWPYSYNSCDAGITSNQSDPSGLSWLPGQRLSSCSCSAEDHPSPGTGRGAPEIDVMEVGVDRNNLLASASQSYQVAPFDIFQRPNVNYMAIPSNFTNITPYVGGPYQQALSSTTTLNDNWYDGKNFQKYAFEYVPGAGSKGRIKWFVGEEETWELDGRAIGRNGNVDQRLISEEPMAMVLNMGMGSSWTEILASKLRFPTTMQIDYIRIYQKAGEESITCDPEGYPTTKYIATHEKAYTNYNVTRWEKAGFDWPKNTLTGC